MDKRHMIAKNVARYFQNGMFVNLGIGIPTLSANYVADGVEFLLHAENGFAAKERMIPFPWGSDTKEQKKIAEGMRRLGDEQGCNWKTGHRDLVDAGLSLVTFAPGAACFDSAVSFAIARGGHLDMTVLGGLQVDECGNLANWMVPGGRINGMGGAMDLVCGSKKVIVAMEHMTKDGAPKLMKKCTMPLTAVSCVDIVVTERCIIEIHEGRMVVAAMAKGETKERLQADTEAVLQFSEIIREMESADL